MPTDSQKSTPKVAGEQLQRLREVSFLEQILPAGVHSESALHEPVSGGQAPTKELVTVANLVPGWSLSEQTGSSALNATNAADVVRLTHYQWK